MCSSDESSRARRTPSSCATASVVTSSVVGPRPPVHTTTRDLAASRSSAAMMRGRSSSTTSCSTTLKPMAVSSALSQGPFVSTSSPRVSSVPMDSTAQVMFRFTGYVMMFAPIGVFAAIAATVGTSGLGVLFTLGKLVGLMYVGLAIFASIILSAVSFLIGVPFLGFVRAIREPFLIAFTTASSEAALPKAMEVMERFGVPKNIVAFVLPTGYSFNLDGSTLYLSLASIFVAQIAGVRLTIGQQLIMMLTLMLTSKGVAGVPRAALVVLAATLSQFGLPLEGAAILLGIDQIMDMGRTAVNVMGNCIATAVVARWEGVLDDERMHAFAQDRRAKVA